jgi:hypothetical protein
MVRRAALVIGVLALVFAPRLVPHHDLGPAPSPEAVGAAVIAPTFFSDGIAPARVAEDVHDVAPMVATVLVGAVALLLVAWLHDAPRRRPALVVLGAAPRWRGPPARTS